MTTLTPGNGFSLSDTKDAMEMSAFAECTGEHFTFNASGGRWTGRIAGKPAGGSFSLYQTDGFGLPQVRLASADGITAADSHVLTVGGHALSNWVFTQPGKRRSRVRELG